MQTMIVAIHKRTISTETMVRRGTKNLATNNMAKIPEKITETQAYNLSSFLSPLPIANIKAAFKKKTKLTGDPEIMVPTASI